MSDTQKEMDKFYFKHGPCCSGCDHWESNDELMGRIGECKLSAPVAGRFRLSMIGIDWTTLPIETGHIYTPRDHKCGEFADTFDWQSLSPFYLRSIGAPLTHQETSE